MASGKSIGIGRPSHKSATALAGTAERGCASPRPVVPFTSPCSAKILGMTQRFISLDPALMIPLHHAHLVVPLLKFICTFGRTVFQNPKPPKFWTGQKGTGNDMPEGKTGLETSERTGSESGLRRLGRVTVRTSTKTRAERGAQAGPSSEKDEVQKRHKRRSRRKVKVYLHTRAD